MPTVHIHETTTVPPDGFVAALTDFGPGRAEIFRNSHAKVHASGDTWADVTEGVSASWERLRYDWSQPNVVRLTTTDSNTWSTGSNWVYTLTPRADGGTDIDLVVARKGRQSQGLARRRTHGGGRQVARRRGSAQEHQGNRAAGHAVASSVTSTATLRSPTPTGSRRRRPVGRSWSCRPGRPPR